MKTPHRALARILPAACLAAAAIAVPAASGSAAHAAGSCTPPKYPGNGYFTSLSVSHVSCATGKKVTLAHYRCRVKHGIKGHCSSTILGYHCKESKRQSNSVEFDARVTCTRGSKKVVYTYQQNTH